ncbi:MAG: hypothetical protein MJ183_00720 [Treponemataceae bacterium]|nr:hypothetical protein [Treponemataceae bacterium]
MGKKEKAKKKWYQVLGIIALVIVAVAAVFLLAVRLYFRLPVKSYYDASEKAFRIPGLSDGFIPQGLDYDEEISSFWVTGYMNDGSASPIYVVDGKTGTVTHTAFMTKEDGSPFTPHAGGLSVYGDYVYVAGGHDCCLYVFERSAILKAIVTNVPYAGIFETKLEDGNGIGVAFTAIDDGVLYAGEFYREANYPTLDSHKMTTPAGDYNQALIAAYEISDAKNSKFGLSPKPIGVISVTDQIQGMAVHGGKIYLSSSYAVAFSNIYVYDMAKATKTVYETEKAYVPMFVLDSASLEQTVKIPPMSEEIVFVDDKMYTMCESASSKYIFGKFTSAQWCYSTKMN